MAALANITLADATPTNEVYKPDGRPSPGVVHYSCRAPASGITTPNGWNTLTLGFSPASTQRPTYRVRTQFAYVNPDYDPDGTSSETEHSVARANLDVIIPVNFALTSREHFKTLFSDWMSDSVFLNSIYTLDPPL